VGVHRTFDRSRKKQRAARNQTEGAQQNMSDAYESVRKKAVEFALNEKLMKVRADSGNMYSGQRISCYQDSLGIGRDDYCVAFVYWCYQMACTALGTPNVLPRTGSTTRLSLWANSDWFIRGGELPQPGDIWMRNSKRHTGLVWYVHGGLAEVITIEGNTYTSSDPRWGVHGRKRNMSTNTLGIIRPTW
jgi:hypothetical protein